MNRMNYLLILLTIFSQVTHSETTQSPNPKELLEKFAKTQEVFNSFTAKTEIEVEYTEKSLNSQFPGGHCRFNSIYDFRFDQYNQRINSRELIYGDISLSIRNVPKDNPMYRSRLYIAGQSDRWYGRPNIDSDPGHGTFETPPSVDPEYKLKTALSRAFKGHEALGYLYANDERVDELLQDADNIHLLSQMQKIGNNQCYIIEAVTDRGRFTLWLDPDHGCNLAKAKYLCKEGDMRNGEKKVEKNEQYVTTLDNVKFEKIDGTWVPIEAEIHYDWKIPGKYNYHEKILYKAVEYKFNPDHDALESFESEDIQNGAKFQIIDNTGVSKDKYTWQNGELIPDVGKSETKK